MSSIRLIGLVARSALSNSRSQLSEAICAQAPASILSHLNQYNTIQSQIGHQIRNFSGSSSLFSSQLTNTLAAEIAEEESSYSRPNEVARGPPSPWALRESPDDTLLTLQRKNGSEDISIDLQVNSQPSFTAEASDEGEELNLVAFNVTVTKGDEALVFECESDGTFIGINHVSLEPKEGHASESAYTGPVFDELDETLQGDFGSYLADRGVTEDVGEYLRHLIYDKEQRSYLAWLKKVKAFATK